MTRLFAFLLVSLMCPFSDVDSKEEPVFTFSRLSINALSEGERELLKGLGVVYLEKLESKVPSISIDRVNGYTSVKKNAVGVCVYHRYVFDGESLLTSEISRKRYVSYVGFDCNERLDDHFAEVENVSDKTAAKILSSFEKNRNDLTKFISFDGVVDAVKKNILENLKGSYISSIGYRYIESLDAGCLVILFSNDKGRLELLGSFEASKVEVVLIGRPIS